MLIGVCHYMTLPGTWEEAIALAGELGFEGVELFVRPPFTAELLDHPERVESIRSAARRAGVALPSIAMTYLGREESLTDPDPATRERAVARARLGLRRCAELGGKVALALGTASREDPRSIAAHVQSLRELAAAGAELGVRVGMETGYTSDESLDVLGQVGSPWVGDYFDVGNVAGRGLDPAEELRRRSGRVVQVHLKGVRGAGLDAGTVDLGAVVRALRETGYDGWLMLETSPGDDPAAAARSNLVILRRHLEG